MSIDRGYGIATSAVIADSYDLDALIADTEAAKAAAQAAQAASELALDTIDDRYLGAKASDPTVDNDGDTLIDGAMFYDTTLNVTKIYDLASTTWKRTTPTTTEQTKIDTVSGIASDITTVATNNSNVTAVAGNATNINTVAGINSNVTTVAGISANTTTVAGISGNVTTVAGISSDVTAVAADATDIGAVAGKATEIGLLGTADAISDLNTLGTADIVSDMNTLGTSGNVTNMNTLAGISSNITTAAGISSDITAVAADATDIGTVATDIADVSTVAGISSNVTTVANNDSNVTAVAGNASNINAVAGNETNINAAVSNASNINSAVSNATNITAVAGNETNINAVNTNSTNINTVATNNTNITTVATDITNVNLAATNIADITEVADEVAKVIEVANDLQEATSEIDTVATNITNVNNVGNDITNVNTVATNLTSINAYGEQYKVAATAPSGPSEGDLWFDTTTDIMKVYSGTSWQNAGSSVNGVENSVEHTATASQTTFTATYDPGYLTVSLNGVQLAEDDYTATNGTSIVLDTGAALNDIVFIQSFGTFALADHYDKTASDARYLQDSEVTNLADVKAFDTTDYATAAQGTTADAALPKAGGTMTGNLSLGDNVKAKFGASDDLQIYHDGDSSYISHNTTGTDLVIEATSPGDDVILRAADDLNFRVNGNENGIVVIGGGATTLYNSNSSKLATTSTGIDVDGTVDCTTVDLGNWTVTESAGVLYFATSGTNKMKLDASGNLTVTGNVTGYGTI